MTKDRPNWWPKNPYGTGKEWYRKSDYEQVWEGASEEIFEAWYKATKLDCPPMTQQKK